MRWSEAERGGERGREEEGGGERKRKEERGGERRREEERGGVRRSEVESGGARWSQAERGGVRQSEVEEGGVPHRSYTFTGTCREPRRKRYVSIKSLPCCRRWGSEGQMSIRSCLSPYHRSCR